MHIAVWGSIASWFVVIPFIGTSVFHGSFFNYTGVANEVLSTAQFWFFWPLAAVISLTPTVMFRFMRLDLDPHLVDDVRLNVAKEGRSLFRRRTFKRKVPKQLATSNKRTGYAFAHQQGFARLIMSGLGFGMPLHEVAVEHRERITSLISASRQGSPAPQRSSAFQKQGTESSISAGIFAATITAAAVSRSFSKPEDADALDVDARSDSITTDPSKAAVPGMVQSPERKPGGERVVVEVLESTSPIDQ